MDKVLSQLISDDGAGIIDLTLTFLAGMIVWLSLQWRIHRRSEMEAALKHEMLERGMSADEIVSVIGAHVGEDGTCASNARYRHWRRPGTLA
jgi:hypothetical protein